MRLQRQVTVYHGRRTYSPNVVSLRTALAPSRAVPRSESPYVVDEDDGPKELYILRLDGDMAVFLGRPTREVDGLEVIKVGYSQDPGISCLAFNRAMPKCAFAWNVLKESPDPAPYPNWKIAQAGEDAMKRKLTEYDAVPLGGEFFLAGSGAIERAWRAGRRAAEEAMKEE